MPKSIPLVSIGHGADGIEIFAIASLVPAKADQSHGPVVQSAISSGFKTGFLIGLFSLFAT